MKIREKEPFKQFFLQDFNTVTIYCCCAYVIASLVSIGLLFNHNSLFYWLECVRCLIFLGYSIYQPIEVDSIVLNIFLYTIRLFYLYSAWMCRHECVKVFSSATEQKIKWWPIPIKLRVLKTVLHHENTPILANKLCIKMTITIVVLSYYNLYILLRFKW